MTFDEFLRRACHPLDLEWRKYRRRVCRHRVRDRMDELGVPDYPSYLERLRSDPVEADTLADRMRVTVTRFFRERERWRLLSHTILPSLLEDQQDRAPLRAWSAGCAGGEEPYSLAMLWLAEILPSHADRTIDILATDIDEASLERAARGVYAASELKEVPETIRQRYFHRINDHWMLTADIRAMVDFALHDLATEPPPARFDLVCCRYLPFTYYRGERLRATARRLKEALQPQGVLMIGTRESLGAASPLFLPFPGAPGFFRPRLGS